MKNRKVIAYAKKNHNLFILKLVQPERTMVTIKIVSIQLVRVMTMIGQGQPTHLISQNKHICFWHYCLIYISNTWVVRASRLTNGIDLDIENKEYNPIEVLIKSDESGIANLLDTEKLPGIYIAQVCQTRAKDIFNKLYKSYVESKSTQVIRHNKSITAMTNKLEEVYTNLLGPHDPSS